MAKPPKPSKTDPFQIQLTDEERTAFTGWLCSEIQNALDARAKYVMDGGLIDLFHALYEQSPRPRSGPWPDAADLTSYLGTQDVDAMEARLVQTVFGANPICAVDGWGEDEQRTAKVEAFHQWKAKDERLAEYVAGAIHVGLIEQNGVLEVTERPIVRKTQREVRTHVVVNEFGQPVLSDKGELQPRKKDDGTFDEWQGDPSVPSVTAHVEETAYACDGPQYRVLSLKDFLYLPGHARNLQGVWGFAKRIFLRMPELKQREAAGYYQNVDELGDEGDREQKPEDTRRGVTIAPQEGMTAEKELWEVHLYYDIDDDGIDEWLIATVSPKHQVTIRLQHDDLKQVRFVSFVPFPNPLSVYGYSFIGDKIWTIIEEHTALRNMKADRGALAVQAPIKRLTTAYWNPDDQPWGPSAVIDVRDMKEVEQMVVADVPASVIEAERAILAANESVTGLNDQSVVGTRPVGANPTATLTQTVAQASFVRVEKSMKSIQGAIDDLYQLRHAIWLRSLKSRDAGLVPPGIVLKGLMTRGMTLPDDGAFAFTEADLIGNWMFIPKGALDAAGMQDFTLFLAQALPSLMKVAPALQQQFAADPKIGAALLQHALRLSKMTDLEETFASIFSTPQPQPAAPGVVSGPMPGGAPAGAPPQLAGLLASLAPGGVPPAAPAPAPAGPIA